MDTKYLAYCEECGHEWPNNGRACPECGNDDYQVILAAFAGDLEEMRTGGLDNDRHERLA